MPWAQYFLKNGANIDSKNDVWGSTLPSTTANDNFSLVQSLVDKGADINSPGMFSGTCPLITTVVTGNWSMFQYFFDMQGCCPEDQHSSCGNILQTSSYLGEIEMVMQILTSGFNVDADFKETGRLESKRSPLGSALIMALLGERFQIAELLISFGADLSVTIPGYGSALHLAPVRGIQSIVKSLVEAGAHVNDDSDLGTPLQAAAANGHEMIVLFLVDSGAEVNAQGGDYGNALEAAETSGHCLIAKLLLFSGAKVIKKAV